ncbi:leucine-rich repeat domain-containing protein [Streptomyces sp. SID3212]|nr:STM4015 family protein [Streptomyces sp. SID3212]MYV57075.1 leucine-rich repeat domain-containing protein [Streptomyces sp. SID3212]
MSYVHHVEQFHGLPAYTFSPYVNPVDLPDPASVAWRFQCGQLPREADHRGRAEVYWARFTESVELEKVRAMVFGEPWYGDSGYADDNWLTDLAPRLTGLEALFLGDLEDDESMISSLYLEDVAPVLAAFPGLRELAVRGGEGLKFPVTGHASLRVLRVQSGGLPPDAAAQIAAADLPSLERLELWLGHDNYGGGTTVEHLAPLLTGQGKPALRHLGLQNSPIQDELAAALASAPVVARLTSLSLSMGALGDEGAEALLTGQPLTHLRELDLSHHFLSHAMMLRVWTELEPHGVRVNLTASQEPEEVDPEWGEGDGRYVAVDE